LKEFEATAMSQAVSAEGASPAVITPIPYWMCGFDTVDIYSEKRIAECSKQVRLDVTASNSQSWYIVSAICRIVHAGRVALASWHNRFLGSDA
jgi:hypothetical protein